jgi:hypothetical protein
MHVESEVKMVFKNQSEKFVYDLAHRSFLSLWSYANPFKKPDGKELCDVLTMFGSNIAIFSVKGSKLSSTSVLSIDRWVRRVIKASTRQIYGAERWIRSATHIIRSDDSQGLPLPPKSEIKIHRIAVGLGSHGKAPIASRDYGKGFVHVFDAESFSIILGELDTASDFFNYLSDKLTFLTNSSQVLLEGEEEDLLAIYLANDRHFPTTTGVISIGAGIWDKFRQRPDYVAKEEADKASVIWDGFIEDVTRHALAGTLEFGSTLSDTE